MSRDANTPKLRAFQLSVATLETPKHHVHRGSEEGLGGAEEVELTVDAPPGHHLPRGRKELAVHAVIQEHTEGGGGGRCEGRERCEGIRVGTKRSLT